jgi:hypothetical protein
MSKIRRKKIITPEWILNDNWKNSQKYIERRSKEKKHDRIKKAGLARAEKKRGDAVETCRDYDYTIRGINQIGE